MDWLQFVIGLAALGAPLWRVALKVGAIEARLESLERRVFES